MSLVKLEPWLVSIYFVLWILAAMLPDYQAAPVAYWLVLVLVAWIKTDFYSGLIHIYLDYHPLDKHKGFDGLFHFAGNRNSPEFHELKKQVMKNASWLDQVVYHFKIHHRSVRPFLGMSYTEFFLGTAPAAAFLLLLSGLMLLLTSGLFADSLFFIILMGSVIALHTNHIHACVHGSRTMPNGVKLVRLLQRVGLMYSNKRHHQHHQAGLSGFCLINGHTDFLVDRVCAWLLKKGWISHAEWRGDE